MIPTLAATRDRIAHSPLALRFLGGAAWSTAGTVVSSGISLVTMMFVAHLLGKETYGQFIVVQSTLGMVGVFAGFGIGAAATCYVAELRSRDKERLARILVLTERATLAVGFIAAVFLALMSGVLATAVLNSPGLTVPLSIAGASVFFSAVAGYQASVLIGLEAMRPLAIGTAVSALAGVPVMLVSAEMYGLNGAAGAMVINAIILAGISRFQMANQLERFSIVRKVRSCHREWRVLRDFSMPALLAGLLVTPAHWVCYAMLANTPNGYNELAVLGVVMQWFNAILFLPAVAGRALLPIFTDHVSDKNSANAKQLLIFAIKVNAAVTFPAAILLAVFSAEILQLYGADFQNGSISMAIGVMTAALLSVQMPVGNMIIAASRIWSGVLMNLCWALVYVAMTYFLKIHGSMGLMTAMGISYVIHAVWSLVIANTLLDSSKVFLIPAPLRHETCPKAEGPQR